MLFICTPPAFPSICTCMPSLLFRTCTRSTGTFLTAAWQVDKKWQRAEPGSCRPVLPVAAIPGSDFFWAFCGRWFRWTALLILGFLAMLHPAELVALTRRDLVFPEEHPWPHSQFVCAPEEPKKTSRFARRQHGRIDDPAATRFIYSVAVHLRPEDKLYPASLSSFQKAVERRFRASRLALSGR